MFLEYFNLIWYLLMVKMYLITSMAELLVNSNMRSDLELELESVNVPLSAANDPTTSDNQAFTIPGLAALTAAGGTYELTLTASGSSIVDLAGNSLAADAIDSWYLLGAPVMDPEPTTTPASTKS